MKPPSIKSLHLANDDDAPKLLPLVAAFHSEMGFDTDATHQEAAVRPLLNNLPHGAIWLIGPRRAPVGYVAISFGWSIEFGGMDAFVDELYIRPAVRRRGMGFDALNGISRALSDGGVCALHLEVDKQDEATARLYQRARFETRDRYTLMSRKL